jgi:molecular chaperone HtpG
MERVLAASRHEKGLNLGASGKQNLEINAKNALIKQLSSLREKDAGLAAEIARQIHDNAMIQAGLVVDPLAMVERNYKILARAAGA